MFSVDNATIVLAIFRRTIFRWSVVCGWLFGRTCCWLVAGLGILVVVAVVAFLVELLPVVVIDRRVARLRAFMCGVACFVAIPANGWSSSCSGIAHKGCGFPFGLVAGPSLGGV